EDANPVAYSEREETGPIYVRGIAPGDVLAIEILDIAPVGHASGRGMEGRTYHPGGGDLLPIRDGRVWFPGGLSTAVHMIIGDSYVTPDGPLPPNPWDNGGNMDFRDICAGHTLLLKAALAGGLLVLGDVHAAQGDGEMAGVGAECAAVVTLRITRDEAYLPGVPTVFKPGGYVCIGSRPSYAEARDVAVGEASAILARRAGCTPDEARNYVLTVGSLRNGAGWMIGAASPPWPEWVTRMPVTVGIDVPTGE
ncbi:MAG: acetamidase/formamidase family protein, partial [Chloroflexota bacterium]